MHKDVILAVPVRHAGPPRLGPGRRKKAVNTVHDIFVYPAVAYQGELETRMKEVIDELSCSVEELVDHRAGLESEQSDHWRTEDRVRRPHTRGRVM